MTAAHQYGVFIWSAYGATALAVAALVIRAVLDHRAQVGALRRLERQAPADADAADA